MTLPPYGICFPVRIRRVVDGDTVEVSFPDSERAYRIRLIDCWAPELREQAGQEAKLFAQRVVDEAEGEVSLFIPPPAKSAHPLDIFTMGRILGHIFVGTEDTLSEIMVRTGHATREKQPKGAAR